MRLYFVVLNFVFVCVFPQKLIGQTNRSTNMSPDFCSVFGKTNGTPQSIKIRALMTYSTISRIDGGDSFLYAENCNNGDYFAVTDFAKLKNSDKWREFFQKLPNERNFIFEVNLQGDIEVSIAPSFGHLSWSRAKIEITSIKSIRDVSQKAQKPDYKAERPLTEKGGALQTLNTLTLFYLVKDKTDENLDEYFSSEYILTDSTGNIFNKSNYQNLSEKKLFSNFESISVSSGRVERNGNKYKVLGTVTFSQADKKHILNYENTFKFRNDWWVLTETKFTML